MSEHTALYLAEILQSEPGAVADAASAELRRLHAVNQKLLEALIELTEAGAEAWGENRPCVRIGLAAIAKAEGQA